MCTKSLRGPIPALLACGALAGCATQPDKPSFPAAPAVIAVYGTYQASEWTDSHPPYLPATQVYSASEPSRTSAMPSLYPALRVEFDQPLDGNTLANLNDHAGTDACPPQSADSWYCPFSFCTQTGAAGPNDPTGAAVQLIDVSGGGRSIPSSVCYDPSNVLGTHPAITVYPGAGQEPFSCNTFTPGTFAEGNEYALALDAARIRSFSGGALRLPTGGGWSSGAFHFTVDGPSMLGVGFMSFTSGDFTLLDKPAKGWLKDLAPAATFAVPVDLPLLIVFSGAVQLDDAGYVPGVQVTRAGGEDVAVQVVGGSGYEWTTWDDSVAVAFPPHQWEPGASYQLTVDQAAVKSAATGKPLGTGTLTFAFKAAAGPSKVLEVSPANGLTHVAFDTAVLLTFSDPVDPDTLTAEHFQLLAGDEAVPATVEQPPLDFKDLPDLYAVQITPLALLSPATAYTVSVKGAQVAPAPAANAAKPLPDYASTFTTQPFRSVKLTRTGQTTSIDRTSSVNPASLEGGLRLSFNLEPDPATVTPSTIGLLELDDLLVPRPIPASYSVAPVPGNPKAFDVKVTDAAYPQRFGQRYQLEITPQVTSLTGLPVRGEGCITSVCPDGRGFITGLLAPTLDVHRADADPQPLDGFTVTFNYAVDPATTDGYLPGAGTAYRLVMDTTNADGTHKLTPVGIACTAFADDPGHKSITCTATSALLPNASYLASATYLQTATAGESGPASVPATLGGLPANVASGTWFGSSTLVFTTDCAPSP